MKYNISKELFESAMNINVFYHNDFELDDNRGGIYYERDNVTNFIHYNDFFFRCKEWALGQGYYLASNMYIGGGCCDYFTDASPDCNECGNTTSELIHRSSEQQAVFDACQWILENKEGI